MSSPAHSRRRSRAAIGRLVGACLLALLLAQWTALSHAIAHAPLAAGTALATEEEGPWGHDADSPACELLDHWLLGQATVGDPSPVAWAARAEVVHAAAQDRVPADDPATASYTLVNLALSYKLRVTGTDGLLFLRLNNVGNVLAYNATSIATVRPLAPLPGRGLMLGLRLAL